MKRILSIFLVLVLSISALIGCSNGEVQIDKTASENSSITQENQPKGIATEDEIGFKTLSEDLIDEENVMEIIEELTSEKYEGRLSGSTGNILAVDYIVEYFKELGLESPEGINDYKQSFYHDVRINNAAPILNVLDENSNVIKEYEFIYEFAPIVYTSDPITKDETIARTVLINNMDELETNRDKFEGKIIVVPEKVVIEGGSSHFFSKVLSYDLGIVGIVYENKLEGVIDYFPVSPGVRPVGFGNWQNGPMIFRCDGEAFSDLLEEINEDVFLQMKIDYYAEEVKSYNIIGLLPGTDEELKEECIIISGHMDHVGNNRDGTYNPGALDNASGTASVMEIARILTQSKIKPEKSILFIAFNGEEEGLCGSDYYVENLLYQINKTTVINLDMVGAKNNMPLSIGSISGKGIQTRKDLSKYCKELGIDYAIRSYEGSDHVPFARLGGNAITLNQFDAHSGYHSPNDTIESVDKDEIKEVIKLVLYYLEKNAY